MIKIPTKFKKSDINFILIIFLTMSTMISYIPNISKFKFIQHFIFVFIFIINIKEIFTTLTKYKINISILIFLAIYYGILLVIENNTNYGDFKVILVSFIIYIVISSIKIDITKKEKIIYFTSVIYILVSFYIIFNIKGNFNINTTNGAYIYGSKNGLGPMLSLAGTYILYMYTFINSKLVYLILYLMSIWGLSILQARTAILGIICASVLLFLIKFIKNNNLIFSMKLLLVIFTGSFIILNIANELIDLILKILRVDSDYSISTILSGRDLAMKYSIIFFKQNPLFGCLYNSDITYAYSSIHNLWIRSLFYGGIIYFLIIIVYVWNLFKNIIKSYRGSKYLLFAVCIQMFISTLFEPLAPFGPGTTYFLFWLILSLNIKQLD